MAKDEAATVVASHKLAEDMVREEEAAEVKVADAADVAEGEDVVEDTTATILSTMAWTCLTTPANSLIMRWPKWAMKAGVTSMLGATTIITVDVVGEDMAAEDIAAEDMAVEEMVTNTRGAPPGEAKIMTLAKWIRLPQMVMGM